MSIIDIILLIPILYGLFKGYRNGLSRELGSLVGIVIGIYLARFLADPVANLLVKHFNWSFSVCMTVAYILVFIAVTLGIQAVAYMFGKFLEIIKIGWLNRILGSFFGGLKFVLILSVLLNIISMIHHYNPFAKKESVTNSVLYAPIEKVMPTVIPFMDFEKFKKLYKA